MNITKNKTVSTMNIIEMAKQAPEKLPNHFNKWGPEEGSPPITSIEKIDFKEKKNYTYFSYTKSNTNDFPTQDMFCPNPDRNLNPKISIAFFVRESSKYIIAWFAIPISNIHSSDK